MAKRAQPEPQPHPAPTGARPTLVERLAPWFLSVSLHALLVLVGFLVVWSVTYLRDEVDRTAIDPGEAEEAVVSLSAADFLPAEMALTPPVEVEQAPPPAVEPMEAELDAALLAQPGDAAHLLAPADAGPGSARFAGTSAAQANRIVYILDASGSMRLRFPIVVNELMRSLDRLAPEQRFLVVLFQEGDALTPDIAGRRARLLEPTAANLEALARWLDEIVPQGTSNPVEALRAAARLDPDTIFLLSNNITGTGRYEISQTALLAELDRLNPVSRATRRREIVINAIQFLDEDPLDTMRLIAERHGLGAESYNFIGRAEVR
jgi:hypothetical protein